MVRSFLLTCLSLVAAGAFAADAPPLTAEVGANAIVVRNVTLSGDVVLMGVSVESAGGLLSELSGALRRTDDDGDGAVTFTLGRSIPFRSIFVLVDVESSRFVIAGPAGYDIATLHFPATLMKKDAEGVLGLFDEERVSAQMLIVTKKGGAWRLVATEGGAEDGDREGNGKLSLSNLDARPVSGTASAPKHLKNGDVIAVIDPGRMEVFVAEIGK